jgi:hypothetical protein
MKNPYGYEWCKWFARVTSAGDKYLICIPSEKRFDLSPEVELLPPAIHVQDDALGWGSFKYRIGKAGELYLLLREGRSWQGSCMEGYYLPNWSIEEVGDKNYIFKRFAALRLQYLG